MPLRVLELGKILKTRGRRQKSELKQIFWTEMSISREEREIFQTSVFFSLFDRHVCLGIVHLLYPFLLIFISASGTMYTYRLKLFHSPKGRWVSHSDTSGSFQWPEAQYYNHFSRPVSGGKSVWEWRWFLSLWGQPPATHTSPSSGRLPRLGAWEAAGAHPGPASQRHVHLWATGLRAWDEEALQTLSVVMRLL